MNDNNTAQHTEDSLDTMTKEELIKIILEMQDQMEQWIADDYDRQVYDSMYE